MASLREKETTNKSLQLVVSFAINEDRNKFCVFDSTKIEKYFTRFLFEIDSENGVSFESPIIWRYNYARILLALHVFFCFSSNIIDVPSTGANDFFLHISWNHQ